MSEKILISTTDAIHSKNVKKVLGLVKGNTVQSRWLGVDIAAALKNLVGGEIKSYTELLTKAREEAISRMVEEAKKLGANAIIGVRFTTANIMANSAEMLAFGTAVKLE